MKITITFFALFFYLFSFSQNSRGSKSNEIESSNSGVKRALVIGISKYKASELNLNFADKDAELFKEYLLKIDSVPKENISFLKNEDATSFNISTALNKLIYDTEEGDIIYLFFAGHGDVVDSNNVEEKIGFLLAHDVNKQREYYGTQGVIPFKDINSTVDIITNKNAKIILVLDACKSGFLYLDGAQKNLEAMDRTFENSTKLLSCKPNQLSYESSSESGAIEQGYFTYYLVLGLMGAADNLLPDFNLQAFELQSFLDLNVSAATSNMQSPVIKTTKSTDILKAIRDIDKSDALGQIENSININEILANRNTPFNTEVKFDGYKDIIDRFNKALKAKDYYDSPTSAKSIIDNIEQDKKVPPELIKNFKDNFINKLSLEAQFIINDYISDIEVLPDGNSFLQKAKYLEICLSYLNKTDFLYDRFLCSKLFLEAYSAIRLKRFDQYLEAKEKLENALKIEDKAAYIYNALGIVLSELEFYDEAFSNFKKANSLIPTWSFPISNIGSNFLDINNYKEAIFYFEKAGDYRFAKKTSNHNIGTTYDRMGRFKDAKNII